MRLTLSMKVGSVSLFASLALLLGLFSSTGIASAHTANTLQSAHISSIALANRRRHGNFEGEGGTYFDPFGGDYPYFDFGGDYPYYYGGDYPYYYGGDY